MDKTVSIGALADEIRALYRQDPDRSRARIESLIGERMREVLPDERVTCLEELIDQFGRPRPKPSALPPFQGKGFLKFFTLVLGTRISGKDLSSPELPERLALSLNTIFDTLNQMVEMIHVSLFGRKVELETIRQILSSGLRGEGGSDSLQGYLRQIQEAFLVAHRSFQQAGKAKIGEILA